MAFEYSLFDSPVSVTATRVIFESSSVVNNGVPAQIYINGTGLGVNASGVINAGTITSLELVNVSGAAPIVDQTAVLGTAASGQDYAAFMTPVLALGLQLQGWNFEFDQNTEPTSSATQATLYGADGSTIVVSGYGFGPFGGAATGTVTSIVHYAADGSTVLHTATGLPQPTSILASAFGGDSTDLVDTLFLAGDDVVTANTSGLNLLEGGAGNDSINGFADGSSMVDYNNATSGINANLVTQSVTTGADTDTLTNINHVDGSNHDDILTGNANENRLYGDDGDDLLDGGAGADRLQGDVGDDTYIVDDNGDTVIEEANEGIDEVESSISYQLVDNVENLTLTGTGDIDGVGNSLDNIITGNDGDNVLEGGAGADTLIGGAGVDIVSYFNASGLVVAYMDAPSLNYGDAAGDSYSLIEGLEGSAHNDFLYGSNITGDLLSGGAGIDQIYGYGGNDVIHGGGDFDYILGGEGDDTINGDAGQDILSGQGGADTINGGDDFDQIYGGLGTDTLNGDGAADYLFGGDDNDILNGGDGNDFLYGQAGDDTLNGDAGIDVLQGGEGNDTLFGGNDGSTGVNGLFGQGGDDRLVSGTGIDYMTGGDGVVDTGNDTFAFGAGGYVDVITDFQAGAGLGDVIEIDSAATGITSFAQLHDEGRLSNVGNYASITITEGADIIYLQDVSYLDLVADDFVFV